MLLFYRLHSLVSIGDIGKKMSQLHDLTGQTFGRWIVLERNFDRPDKKNTYWLCRCSCGNSGIVGSISLKAGTSQSCGCLWLERMRLSEGEAGFNKLYDSYGRKAKTRNLEFRLTREEFRRITQANCYYCGIEPLQECYPWQNNKTSKKYSTFIYNGVDRIDNEQGYIMENCVAACGKCNRAKMQMNYQEFMNWLDRIAQHRRDR